MLTWRAIATTFMALCPAIGFAALPQVDSQLWGELDARHAMGADLAATAIVAMRIANDLPNPTLTAAGLQIDYQLGSWLVSGTGYYVSIRNAATGAPTTIWLPAAALGYGLDVGRLALSDRNRVEQLEGLPGSPARYRNRASADWHTADQRRVTDVFIADELFYDFFRGRWTRNRAQAGLQVQLRADTKLQLFYMRQNNVYGTLERLNVLGLTLQLDIE